MLFTPQNSSIVNTAAKVTTYTISASDDVLTGDTTGGGFTMTLPLCSSVPGKIYRIKKIATDLNVLTVAQAAASSDTIFDSASATSTTLNTTGEEIELTSFGGTIWQVTNRKIPSVWAVPAANSVPAAAAFGTINSLSNFVRREEDSAHFRIYFACGVVAGGAATIALPTGYVLDSTKMSATAYTTVLGTYWVGTNSATPAQLGTGAVTFDGTTSRVQLSFRGKSSIFDANVGTDQLSNSFSVYCDFVAPISGWKG